LGLTLKLTSGMNNKQTNSIESQAVGKPVVGDRPDAPAPTGPASGSALPVGLDSYVLTTDDRPDLFQHDEGHYHFPCSACIHVRGPREHCLKCKHYVL
jgi:hypothetical protein